MNNLISIITPAYNSERFIAQTIQSVLEQEYSDWELLIIIDAKSSDKTAEIASQFSALSAQIRILTDESCRGVSNNRNFGIRHAHGRFIAFLDSDDLWHPAKLKRQHYFMLKKNAVASCHSYQPISEDGQQKLKVRPAIALATYNSLLQNNTVGCLTVMLEKSILPANPFKDEPHEDFGLWLEISKKYPIFGLNENLASYRIVEGSRSNNKFYAAKSRWNVLRNREKLSLLQAAESFLQYAFSSVAKRIGLKK